MRPMKQARTKSPFGGRRKQRFLELLVDCSNVTLAAKAAGVARCVSYEHRKTDEVFAAGWEEAEQVATDRLEAEAWRRAVEGESEPLVLAGPGCSNCSRLPYRPRPISSRPSMRHRQTERPKDTEGSSSR
jgi:hypothetical protein